MINIQYFDDNECLKWCLVTYLNPADHDPARITEADKDFSKRLDCKDIKFPVKTRGIHKIEIKKSIGISVFGNVNKKKHPAYVSKKCYEEKHVDLLLMEKKTKDNMFLSNILIR